MKKVATFDLETNGLLDDVTTVWCGVVKDHSTRDTRVFDQHHIVQLCKFLDTYDVLIGHNSIAFDFPVLRKLYGWEYHGTKVDTLIMSRTQRPNRRSPKDCSAGPHSVEAWGIRLGYEKVQNEEWGEYSDNILERCKRDVEIQYNIFLQLLEEGKGEGWRNAHMLNAKLFALLQKQEEYGWTVDQEKITHNIYMLEKWIDKIDQSISSRLPMVVDKLEVKKDGEYNYVKKPFKKDGNVAVVTDRYWGPDSNCVSGPFCRVDIRQVNLDSNMEVKTYLLSLGWQPKEWNTNGNNETTSAKLSKDDPFKGIQGSLGKLVAKRIQCRHRLSTLQGWNSGLREDGRITPRVAGIASTGRLRHNVIVNVPSPHSGAFFAKQMRQVFVAKNGWVLVGVDSKGNQVRQLAARMGDEEFTAAVLHGTAAEGTDLHSLNQRKSGAPTRSQAKNFFYGLIFGAGPATIAKQIKSTPKRAKELIANYYRELPKLRKCVDSLTAEWQSTAQRYYDNKFNKLVYKNGYITGLDGRPILVDSPHKVLCYTLQSDEAIQMAYAYVHFHEEAHRLGYEDWGMCIWMHDEMQFECKPEIAEELGELASEAITWAGVELGINCPHEGEYIIGRNWFNTH